MNILIWMALHFVLRSKTKHQNLLLHLSTTGHLSFQSFTANINVDQKKKEWCMDKYPPPPETQLLEISLTLMYEFVCSLYS